MWVGLTCRRSCGSCGGSCGGNCCINCCINCGRSCCENLLPCHLIQWPSAMTWLRSKVCYLIHYYHIIHHGIFFTNNYGIHECIANEKVFHFFLGKYPTRFTSHDKLLIYVRVSIFKLTNVGCAMCALNIYSLCLNKYLPSFSNCMDKLALSLVKLRS